MSDDVWVTIPRQQYQGLLQDQRELAALEAAGVDNWEGYEYAMEILSEDDDG